MAEEFDDIFEGYENDLQKAVALIEWQKSEIESLTVNMNAFGLAAKRLAEERQEVARKILSDLEKKIHDRAVYTGSRDIPNYIDLKTLDAIIDKIAKEAG